VWPGPFGHDGTVSTAFALAALALLVFYLLLLARVVLDVTRSFARSWRPAGPAAVGLELLYSSTDAPVKTLRRLIPPLRIFGISIDLSLWLLLLATWVLRSVCLNLVN
jgi:YggT family protein